MRALVGLLIGRGEEVAVGGEDAAEPVVGGTVLVAHQREDAADRGAVGEFGEVGKQPLGQGLYYFLVLAVVVASLWGDSGR